MNTFTVRDRIGRAFYLTTAEAMRRSRIHSSLVWSVFCKIHGLRKRPTKWGSLYYIPDLDEIETAMAERREWRH
jgi:uncharacterized protein (DUF1810 family)